MPIGKRLIIINKNKNEINHTVLPHARNAVPSSNNSLLLLIELRIETTGMLVYRCCCLPHHIAMQVHELPKVLCL